MLTVGSLFSGIGGMELGLERTGGFKTVWQVEIDEYCQKVLAKHWPDVARFRDVRTVGSHNLTPVDLICGGFPCQDISNAGKQAGITGSRSGLWKEFYRIICELRPSYVLVENVAALLGRGIDTVLGDLAACGYDAEWQTLPAAAFGAPHLRNRVFIVAYPNNIIYRRRKKITQKWRTDTSIHGQIMADSTEQQLEIRQIFTKNTQQKLASFARDCSTGTGQWTVEPSILRVAHGLPFELDFIRGVVNEQSDNTEAKPKIDRLIWTILRKMWECQELAKTSPELYIGELYHCVSTMSYKHPYGGWLLGKRIEEDQGLRDLWQAFYTASFQEAQDMQPRLLERIGKKKRPEEMGSRTDRLKGLGNAVVPQVAEYIGSCILARG